MDMKGAMKHIEKNIITLEKEQYNFETVAMKRYEQDKLILAQMRADFVKIEAISAKKDAGEEITAEELAEIPPSLR